MTHESVSLASGCASRHLVGIPLAQRGRSGGAADFERRIAEFQAAHPTVPIIDPVARVRPLLDRAAMLGALGNGGITILVTPPSTRRLHRHYSQPA